MCKYCSHLKFQKYTLLDLYKMHEYYTAVFCSLCHLHHIIIHMQHLLEAVQRQPVSLTQQVSRLSIIKDKSTSNSKIIHLLSCYIQGGGHSILRMIQRLLEAHSPSHAFYLFFLAILLIECMNGDLRGTLVSKILETNCFWGLMVGFVCFPEKKKKNKSYRALSRSL